MKYTVLIGRILFAAIFLVSGPMHFTKMSIQYAASAGVPLASIAVPASGILALAGALSIILGYKGKWGAWLLVLFLVPVTLSLHQFWAAKDAMMYQMQFAMFMKNISILGGAILIANFGTGALSLDNVFVTHHVPELSLKGR
jgi:putative oxidoreductase